MIKKIIVVAAIVAFISEIVILRVIGSEFRIPLDLVPWIPAAVAVWWCVDTLDDDD